jgi:hypothetical protein
MIPIKLHTENFDGEAKKVGEVAIGNETIPVFEFSVKVVEKKRDVVFDYDGFRYQYNEAGRYGKGKYEQKFLNMAQKLQDEIEKLKPVALTFIYSNINRYSFYDVNLAGRDSDNPLKGFLQTWNLPISPRFGAEWLTWIETAAVADKIEKNESFQTAFEKWALAKFLHLVFGDRFLSSPPNRYGSEANEGTKIGSGNGLMKIGNLEEYYIHYKSDIEYSFPDYNCELGFLDVRGAQLSEKDLELLYEVSLGKRPPRDFYKNIFELM